MHQLSVVTNACSLDADRLRMSIPHWMRVFGERATELLVVIDPTPPTGRIAALHGERGSLDEVRTLLGDLASTDDRVRVIDMPTGDALHDLLARWFRRGQPMRCQAGTPIAAFVSAFDAANEPLVVRLDCDMLIHDGGWIDAAATLLVNDEADLVEPARCGWPRERAVNVSTRLLMMNRAQFAKRILPMPAWRLGWLRRCHRRLQGRPVWLALEQMLDREWQAGRLRFRYLHEASSGMSLHVATRADARLPSISRAVAALERGDLPIGQIRAGSNFTAAAWAAPS